MRGFLLLIVVLTAPLLSSCQHRASQPTPTAPVAVQVRADSRIELMSVVQLLSGYFLVTKHEFAYKSAAREYFGPYQGHRAVTLFKEMSKGGFRFNSVPDVMLRLTQPPGLNSRLPFSVDNIGAAGSAAKLAEFVAAMGAFAADSQFQRFYDEHKPFYDDLADRTRPAVVPVMALLESYTGTPTPNAQVVIGPLLHDGGFASYYELPHDTSEAYALVGPVAANNDLPDFGNEARLADLVLHEFSHLTINPLTEAHSVQVNAYAHHMAPIATTMAKRGYSSWESTVNEHMIRAITTRIVTLSRGPADGEKALASEVGLGFVYVPALVERLKFYEQNRTRYKTIADFYPELLKVFAEDMPA